MQVLLIAESSEYFRNALAKALSADFQVHTCADGYAALELLHTLQPDGLILNLSLSFLDGLSVLQQAPCLPPVVMVLYGTRSAYILRILEKVGVSFLMPIPCTVRAVRTHFLELMEDDPKELAFRKLQSQAATHLDLLGFPAHINGYRMLCLAIALYHSDPLQTLSKEIYPAIAQLLGNIYEIPAIEHNIRHAIDIAWHHRDSTLWKDYFPKNKLPSNKQLIAAIARKLP